MDRVVRVVGCGDFTLSERETNNREEEKSWLEQIFDTDGAIFRKPERSTWYYRQYYLKKHYR